MEQKDQNTTPTQTVTNEDNDIEMGSSPETTNIQEQEIVEQGQEQEQVTEIPIEGPATSNDEMNVEEEVKEEVKEEKEEIDPPSTVAVIDTAAMEKTWKEEFNNLVKRLKNGKQNTRTHKNTHNLFLFLSSFFFLIHHKKPYRSTTKRGIRGNTRNTLR